MAPRTERGPSWLKIAWLAGDNWTPWHRVQRWAIWQMTPIERAPLGIASELRGPNPRVFGRWSSLEQRFIRSREFHINREQWELYQETGCWGQLYWIVQGPPGGHRRRWDDRESRLSQAFGGAEQPPPPGELPYQPFSPRVVERLREHDLVLRYGRQMPTLDQMSVEDRQREREFKEKLLNIEVEQVTETLTFTRAQLGAIRDEWRRRGRAYNGPISSKHVVDTSQVAHELIHAEG